MNQDYKIARIKGCQPINHIFKINRAIKSLNYNKDYKISFINKILISKLTLNKILGLLNNNK